MITGYTYDSRQPPEQEHLTYTYDRQGNMLSDGRNQYTYDDFGRLVLAVTAEGGNIIRYIRGLGLISSDSENARTYYNYKYNVFGNTISSGHVTITR